MSNVRRRDVVSALCGGAAAWPFAVRAEPRERIRRVAVIMNTNADEPDTPERVETLQRALQELGWIEGRNLQTEYRWGAGDLKLYRQYAAEMVALDPDVILATAGPIVAALQRETSKLPIVFTTTIDPVGLGYVASAARPGGNATGVAYVAQGFSEKYLELLKEIDPTIRRVGVIRDLTATAGNVQYETVQARASRLGLMLTSVDVRNAEERERAVAALSHDGNAGLVVTAGVFGTINRNGIIALAAQYRLPAVYPNRFYVKSGGLLSYGPAFLDQYRRAAGYIDQILRGSKPADLPVQAPTNYETLLNMKTAKALGLVVPRIILARIDEFVD